MVAWYNDTDPYAARWLQNLIDAGHIAPGVVDARDIRNISPDELKGYTQLHFFAGIGGWSLALRQAGWPDDRPVWTGSCPCQPFSNSGQQKAFDDDRHLWPIWFNLIKTLKPATIFGEQVAAKTALAWLDLVSADLENAGYAVGAADLCAAGVGTPHIRQRLWFGAELRGLEDANGACLPVGMQNSDAIPMPSKDRSSDRPAGSDRVGGMGDANLPRSQGRTQKQRSDQRAAGATGLDGQIPWAEPDWIWLPGTINGDRLNPAFARWLMGYPPEWDACAPMATRSCRKSRPHSSKPSKKAFKPTK